jgi:hypothetical protein
MLCSPSERAGGMKQLRCLGGPLDGKLVDDGEAPTVFLEKTAGDGDLGPPVEPYARRQSTRPPRLGRSGLDLPLSRQGQ